MSTDSAPSTATVAAPPILRVTDEAAEVVLGALADEPDGAGLGLRVAVSGTEMSPSMTFEFSYDLSLHEVEGATDDAVYEVAGLTVIIPADSVANLTGATLDVPSNPLQGGLVIRNPNRPDMGERIDLSESDSVTERLQSLLNNHVNPSLAAHGGYVELVRVEDSKAFLLMGGGCQGCTMSAATLHQGVAAIISQHVPEILDVVDVTDHAAGENPFYQ
ncbi:MAG: NifU family protein [bacterium]|nr:NifU family protein [bacterium]MCY3925139.1 NifU family protein [bacterium]